MTQMRQDHLAKEAERLITDPVLVHAIMEVRKDALENLASADASDVTEIIRWQQRVAVVDEILLTLRRYILAMPEE